MNLVLLGILVLSVLAGPDEHLLVTADEPVTWNLGGRAITTSAHEMATIEVAEGPHELVVHGPDRSWQAFARAAPDAPDGIERAAAWQGVHSASTDPSALPAISLLSSLMVLAAFIAIHRASFV